MINGILLLIDINDNFNQIRIIIVSTLQYDSLASFSIYAYTIFYPIS